MISGNLYLRQSIQDRAKNQSVLPARGPAGGSGRKSAPRCGLLDAMCTSFETRAQTAVSHNAFEAGDQRQFLPHSGLGPAPFQWSANVESSQLIVWGVEDVSRGWSLDHFALSVKARAGGVQFLRFGDFAQILTDQAGIAHPRRRGRRFRNAARIAKAGAGIADADARRGKQAQPLFRFAQRPRIGGRGKRQEKA